MANGAAWPRLSNPGNRQILKKISALLAVFVIGSEAAACADDIVIVEGGFGKANFASQIADEPQERAQGLMFVEAMPLMAGMLFVYEAPTRASFWMDNTLIPLDMLFAEADGTIVNIHENAVPFDRTTIFGGEDIQYVFEINGGLSARLGISTGDRLRHPLIAGSCE